VPQIRRPPLSVVLAGSVMIVRQDWRMTKRSWHRDRPKEAHMQVTVWRNGKHCNPRVWYGLSVPKPARKRYFDQKWREVILVLPGGDEVAAPLTPTFWTTCNELRPAAINRWLRDQHLAPWPEGMPPPSLEMTPLGGNRFSLTVPSNR
jgi:hypothetical protein